jgi:hypothetical protein
MVIDIEEKTGSISNPYHSKEECDKRINFKNTKEVIES